MSDFLNFVLSYLGRAIIMAVFAMLAGSAVLWAVHRRFRQKHGKETPFPWARAVLILMLMGYLSIVMFVTLRQGGYYNGRANLHLFRAWREAWNSFSERQWMNVLLNIAMFVPLGIFVPLLWKRIQKWYLMLAAGLGTSLFIEIMQYLKGSGLFDVDDLFTNTLGAMIGFCLVTTVLSLRQKQWIKAIDHLSALTAVAVAIGGVFMAYELQAYGNLSSAPAFRVDTDNVQWIISCPLSEEEQTVSVYHTKPWSKADCEAFGRTFLEKLGAERVDVTIYNDEVYLREYHGARILEVFYHGGTYSFADLEMSRDFVQTDEQTLRDALLDYGIQIPEGAEFSCPDGKTHYFRVDRYVEGDTMTDGTVAVQWEDGHGICTIDNSLVSVTYHGTETIISENAAARRLMAGHMANGEWFERNNPPRIEILSCELVYRMDTKGFYQPVYEIYLKDPATDAAFSEIVPAIP